MSKPDFYIVVGASAGGLPAITELVSQLHEKINAAVFIVLHLSKIGMGDFLMHRLQKYTPYTCKIARNGETITAHTIYIAPPDEHLLIKNNELLLGSGTAENRWRPSIDVLFSSAAAHHAERVIGIILTGYLNDGTFGMLTIKQCGGHCIIQDPNEADYPEMPLSVIENIEVDFCVSLKKMGEVIESIIKDAKPNLQPLATAEEVMVQAHITEKAVTGTGVKPQPVKILYTCPDCGSNMWQVTEGSLQKFRCYKGHAYTEDGLVLKQIENIDSTIWIAIRMMEERTNLLKTISARATRRGYNERAQAHWELALAMEMHISKLKGVLFKGQHL